MKMIPQTMFMHWRCEVCHKFTFVFGNTWTTYKSTLAKKIKSPNCIIFIAKPDVHTLLKIKEDPVSLLFNWHF